MNRLVSIVTLISQGYEFFAIFCKGTMRLKFNLKFYVNYEFGKDFLRKLKLRESIVERRRSCCRRAKFFREIYYHSPYDLNRKCRNDSGFTDAGIMERILQKHNNRQMGAAW